MKRWREWRRKKREEKAASRRSKEIDKQLKAWAEEEERTWKIHLLGQRNSGRSTFLKQMRLLHEPGWFSDERRFSYRTIIYSSILQLMTSLIRRQELLQILLSNPKNEDYKQEVIKTNCGTEVKPFFLYVESLKSLWEDEGIQMTLKHTTEEESLVYFMNHLDRIGSLDYVPSDEDILHVKAEHTIGVVQTLVPFKHPPLLQLLFVEFGGTRTERRKWIQAFEGVKAVLFFLSSNGFDRTLIEDGTTNQLEEAANIFEVVVNSRFYRNIPFVVVFTKTDLLQEKIQHKNIKDHFPNFIGDPCNLDDVKQFLRTMLESKCCRDSSKVLGYHFIDTTNTEDVEVMINGAPDAIVRHDLAILGLL